MTRGTRLVFGVGEILGVRIQCRVEGCSNELVYQVPNAPPDRDFSAPTECTACRERGQYDTNASPVAALLRAMQRCSGVRFEMRTPESPLNQNPGP